MGRSGNERDQPLLSPGRQFQQSAQVLQGEVELPLPLEGQAAEREGAVVPLPGERAGGKDHGALLGGEDQLVP